MSLTIRIMTTGEIGLALDWAAAEGWNPGRYDAAPFLAADPEGFLIGTPASNPAALAERHGLRPTFETARMYAGPAPALASERTYGINSFELG